MSLFLIGLALGGVFVWGVMSLATERWHEGCEQAEAFRDELAAREEEIARLRHRMAMAGIPREEQP